MSYSYHDISIIKIPQKFHAIFISLNPPFSPVFNRFSNPFHISFFSSMLTSQGLILATAMAVSAGTIILKYYSLQSQIQDQNQVPKLKSCLSSESKKNEKKQRNKKKKRVRFADDVKDSNGNGELYRKSAAEIIKRNYCCGNEIQKMPANRVALYSGILKDRVQRIEIECSY